MFRMTLAIVLAGLCLFPNEAWSQSGSKRSHPRVYGFTGTPYGPTQSHYQYMRQYGRSWDGTTRQQAMSLANGSPQFVGGFGFRRHRPFLGGHVYGHYGYPPYAYWPYSYGPFGYSFGLNYNLNIGFGPAAPIYGYYPVIPPQVQENLNWAAQNLAHNPALVGALRENELRWNQPLEIKPVAPKVPKMAQPSTPEAKLRSIRHQAHGDVWFRQQNYHEAYSRYKKAVASAGDLPEPRIRLGYVLTAVGHYERAVREFKAALQLDPGWPQTGEGLGQLLGPDNELARGSIVHKVADWVREDVRDPDRLFLMGVVLHFNNPDQAAPFFETALRLAGAGDHLHAFLQPDQPADAGAVQANGGAAAIGPQAQDPELVPPVPAPDEPIPPAVKPNAPAAPPMIELPEPEPPSADQPQPDLLDELLGPRFPEN